MKCKVEPCSKCSLRLPIVNRKYALCNYCNKERIEDVSGTKVKKQASILKRVGIKKQSDKGKRLNDEYGKVIREIAVERPYICEGCRILNRPLSNSHLIPRSVRKDLIACKENIRLHCLEWNGVMGCHDKWEQRLWDGMFDLDDNLEIVKKLDPDYYKRLMR